MAARTSSTASGSSGKLPQSSLIYFKGALYGTTRYGGANDLGTFFSVTTGGTETVVHSFAGADGANPLAGLTHDDGRLYGTTFRGGAADQGAVFVLTPAGEERVLYSFEGGRDGATPEGGVIVKG